MIKLQGLTNTGGCCYYSIRSFSTTHSVLSPIKNDSIKEIPNHYSHYQVLGISPTAEHAEVKSAFRKLSKKFHPDMNQRVSSKRKKILNNNYIKIVESYEVLSHNDRRQKYDQSIQGSGNHGHIRPTNQRDFTNNTYYQERKMYSTGGINVSRGRVHYGPGYREAKTTYSNFDKFTSATGSNYDVPHFDYDQHLKGTLSFERRMINKRLHKASDYFESIKSEENDKADKERNKIHHEIHEILNLQRYGTSDPRTRYKETNVGSGKAVFLVGTLGILAVGGMLLH